MILYFYLRQESKKEKKKKEAEDKPEGDAGDAALAGEEDDHLRALMIRIGFM